MFETFHIWDLSITLSKILDLKFCSQNLLHPKSLGFKISFEPDFGPKIFLWTKIFVYTQKFFWVQFFFDQQYFWTKFSWFKDLFCTHNFLETKFFFGPQKKKFLDQRYFWTNNIFGPKIFLDQIFFGSAIFFDQRYFLTIDIFEPKISFNPNFFFTQIFSIHTLAKLVSPSVALLAKFVYNIVRLSKVSPQPPLLESVWKMFYHITFIQQKLFYVCQEYFIYTQGGKLMESESFVFPVNFCEGKLKCHVGLGWFTA